MKLYIAVALVTQFIPIMIIFMQKLYNYKYKLSAQYKSRKHKNEHNQHKIGEMPKSIRSKFWSIMDSSLSITLK